MLEKLKEKVLKANLELVEKGLVFCTWGNASGIDREKGLVVIKPSGIDYETMKAEDMVVVDLQTGEVIEGKCKPSSDTPTHLVLYRRFPEIGGVAHTHSINAVAFAQAGVDLPALGTTHADHFYGDVPCTRELSEEETKTEYEKNTGKVIVEEIEKRKYGVMSIPAILVNNHGPFSWGKDADEAVFNSVVLDKVAEMAIKTLLINKNAKIKKHLLKKHYLRKHGAKAYYGQ